MFIKLENLFSLFLFKPNGSQLANFVVVFLLNGDFVENLTTLLIGFIYFFVNKTRKVSAIN